MADTQKKINISNQSIKIHTDFRPYLITLVVLIAAIILSLTFGSVAIPPQVFSDLLISAFPGIQVSPAWPETFITIIYQIRLPHTILIALTGAALAGSGAAYQGLFRNPLADPYLLGVAAGAGLGAVLALSIQWPTTLLGYYTVPAIAFLGATITIAIVYNLARMGRSVPTTTLILAGVVVSSFATALTSFLMIRSDAEIRRAISWLLGGSVVGGWGPVWAMLPYITVGLAFLIYYGHALNVLQFGEEQAQTLGLSINRIKLGLVLAASLTTATAVAFAGVIGFVGLVVPHLVRFLWGPDYRHLIPLSILAGVSFLLIEDMIARTILAPQVLPLGIVTALTGAPFFLWVLRRTRNQTYW
jgi:iron complex transport system permease protein